jgi:L-ascorbate metabolism protein UlaG (beta-lactamase superfamily)
MKWIGEYYKPDVIMIPIGGHFVMSLKDAAVATEMIKPKVAIPIHYGTFPPLKGTPQEYQQALGATAVEVMAINPGDKLSFP